MKKTAKSAAKWLVLACLVLAAAGVVAPRVSADRYRGQIQAALEKALGRKVEIGNVHLNVFTGVGFAVDRVTIHEDESIGIEPLAYVNGSLEAVPRVWSLFTGRLEFSSIRLDDCSINVTKSGPPSEPGRWNFAPLLNRSLVRAFPEIHVRSGRINFKFGDNKSVFYLTDTDLDIYPPSRGGADWSVRFSGAPARTDRPAHGFGYLAARGTWTAPGQGRPDRLDLDLQLERSAVGEILTLVHGETAGIHGTVASRMRLTGPLDNVEIHGRVMVEDVHRWDLLPPQGQGWPLNLQGRLNLTAQTLELESSSPESLPLPLSLRFRMADYLSRPHWAVAVNWNRFPLAPLLDLARHMGARIPPGLQLTGTLDGALGYQGEGSLQGEFSFHDTAVTIPDSPPIRFEQASLAFGGGHAHLAPALVRTANDDQAQLEADYRFDTGAVDLTILTPSMHVASLRSQVALAAVPWLEQVASGTWSGQLRYQYAPSTTGGWSGQLLLKDATFPLPGVSEPLNLDAARAQIQGARVVLDRIHAHVGKVAVEGDYRYEPLAVRPHRLRVNIADLDAAELERLLTPTLYRARGLIARALNLGKAPLPDWLGTRRMEGTVQVGTLRLADTHIDKLRARMIWDGVRGRLENLTGRLGDGSVNGVLSVSLRGARPVYLLSGRLKNVNCRSGKIDAEGALETRGLGAELLANLRSQGTFSGRALELGLQPVFSTVSGTYRLAWAKPEPRLRLTDLQASTDDETYTGSGATQDDGRLLIQLTGGGKELRMTGTLAKMKVEETP